MSSYLSNKALASFCCLALISRALLLCFHNFENLFILIKSFTLPIGSGQKQLIVPESIGDYKIIPRRCVYF